MWIFACVCLYREFSEPPQRINNETDQRKCITRDLKDNSEVLKVCGDARYKKSEQSTKIAFRNHSNNNGREKSFWQNVEYFRSHTRPMIASFRLFYWRKVSNFFGEVCKVSLLYLS